MVTAAESYFGRSKAVALGADFDYPIDPYVRIWEFTSNAPGNSLILPPVKINNAYVSPPAVGRRHTIFIAGANDVDLLCSEQLIGPTTLQAGRAYDVLLLDDSRWLVTDLGVFATGGTLNALREPWRVTLNQTAAFRFNLRTHLNAQGYTGVAPAAITLEIAASVVRGADVNAQPDDGAIDSGEYPAGTTLLILNRGTITGRGGDGGRGGDVPLGLLPFAGRAGSTGLVLRCSTSIANYGVIQGGGGGGGGGSYSGQVAGRGGGGGAGFKPGAGGAPGLPGAAFGSDGSLHNGGNGGNSGGNPGSAGGGGGNGGAAGSAIRVASAFQSINWLTAGTVLGATTVF